MLRDVMDYYIYFGIIRNLHSSSEINELLDWQLNLENFD